MSHGKKVQRLSSTDHFKNLSSDILSLILNSLTDRDIFRSVLFVNKLFLNTCYQKYIIKQKVDNINISKFSNAYHIAFRHAIMIDPKKCKKIIEIKEKQWPGDYFHGYELKLDFKNLHAYINFEFFMQGKAIIDITTPLLKTKYSSSEHCTGIIFKNMKGIDMTFTNCEDSNNRHNLDVDEMPKDLEKIRIKNPQLNAEPNFHYSIVKFDPDKLISKWGSWCFDYNKFITSYPKVTEMLLFFESQCPLGPINLPSHITRFGIQPITDNKNLTLDLTNANLKELIIWHDKAVDLHYQYRTTYHIKIIPPLSKTIEKLMIKMYEFHMIEGLTDFKQIDHLIVHRTQGKDDTQQGDQTCNLLSSNLGTIIPKMTFIDNYLLTTPDFRYHQVGLNVKHLEFVRCRFDDTEIRAEKLKTVVFWQIQKNSEGNYGMIKLPDCVEVITITLESMKYISNIPKNLRKVRVGMKNLSDDLDETIRIVREMTKIECEIVFMDYDLYDYKDEVLLSD